MTDRTHNHRAVDPAAAWDVDQIPALDGQTIVITGSNTGIGFEAAAAVMERGATVVLACRNPDKATSAREAIEARGGRGRVEIVRLDLSDQSQIAEAASEVLDRFPRIDRLINNAGVMAKTRQETADGFELSLGTNHLGHFAFVGRVLPAVLAAPRSRVVTVVSMAQKHGRLRWDDLQLERVRYRQFTAYAQSKLANTIFSIELQRRLSAAAADTTSLAADPGFASTDILHGADPNALRRLQRRVGERFIPTAGQAARSQLRAATDPSAHGGQLFAPCARMQTMGPPVAVPLSKRSLDEGEAIRLWTRSEELTGVEFDL